MKLNGEALFDYLTEQGLQPSLLEDDTEIVVDCPSPECAGKSPKLYISPDTGGWICFRCHEEGNLHQFLMRVAELTGPEAFEVTRKLRGKGDNDDEREWVKTKEKPKPSEPTNLMLPATFRPIDYNTPEVFKRYLKQRHVSLELAAARNMGYAISGRYNHRVIIPVVNDGVLYTYIARTVLTICPSCTEVMDRCACSHKYPKVLTPSSAEGARPSLALYNLDAVRDAKMNALVITEGVFDALRLPHQAVALMGSGASLTQRTLIAGLAHGRDVILALDPDPAGFKGTLKLADALMSSLIKVRVALLPDGEDVGSMKATGLQQALLNARPYTI